MRVIAFLLPLSVLIGSWACSGDDTPFSSNDPNRSPDAGAGEDATGGASAGPDAGALYCKQGCATGSRCDELTDECVECLFDHDCGEAARCTAEHECIATVACDNSLDCTDAPGGASVCDEGAGLCAECVTDADCGEDARCLDAECTPFAACETTDDCESGVCDEADGACVECVEDPDCGDGQACVRNACRDSVSCASDNDCTPLGMLCDRELERCVSCRRHTDCPAIYHCADGDCVLDVCDQEQTACDEGAVVACSDSGDAFVDPVACESGAVCVAFGAEASCVTPEGGVPTGDGGTSMDGGGEADGGPGEDGGATCTTVFYRDSDEDGFGSPDDTVVACEAPSGYVDNADDCYDASALAKPGQTEYFDTDRGDGSYDYDCNQEPTPLWTASGSCSSFPTCSSTAGWTGQVPECGDPGTWLVGCTGLSTFCDQDTEPRDQKCR